MQIKWNKSAVKQLIKIIEYLESKNETIYAEHLEKEIFDQTNSLIHHKYLYQIDRIKQNNDGSFFAFEIDSYRVSYRKLPSEIRILRIRHTSRRPFNK